MLFIRTPLLCAVHFNSHPRTRKSLDVFVIAHSLFISNYFSLFSLLFNQQHTAHNFRSTNDNNGITRLHECPFIESKSPSLMHLHHHQQQQRRERQQQLQRRYRIKSSEPDDFTTMHFSPPPSKCNVNTDFTNINIVNESGRGGGGGGSGDSLSHRQSLIGEYGRGCVFTGGRAMDGIIARWWTMIKPAVGLLLSLGSRWWWI